MRVWLNWVEWDYLGCDWVNNGYGLCEGICG